MEDVFTSLSSMALPDAIDAFTYRVDSESEPSGPELFACRVLREIDMDHLRTLADEHEVGVVYIKRMQAFYLRFDRKAMDKEDELLLLQIETVLNRLVKLKYKIGSKSPSEEACSVLDMRSFQRVTSQVSDLLSHAGGWNPFAQPGTVRCKPGGEWDVRTRMASLCETISPITRLDYTFDCDAAAGVMVVRFACPDASSMPCTVCSEDDAEWYDLDEDTRADLALEHSHRIALLLAAAGFASGLRISRVYVVGEDAVTRARTFALAFDRPEFMASIAPFAAVLTRTPLEDMVCTQSLEDHLCGPDQPVPEFSSDRYLKPQEDSREFPPELRELLLADTAHELNVMEPEDDPSMIHLKRIQARMATDPQHAFEELLDLISSLEARCAAAELSSSAPMQSQFCENSLGRIVLPLLEDDPSARFHRAPDALYVAQVELVMAYVQAEAFDLALPEAQKLLDMASTSSQAHLILIGVLARLGRYEDVEEVCRHGMRVAYDAESISYYLYRLAFAAWAQGKDELALACYSLVPARSRVSGPARSEMRALMKQMGVKSPLKREQAADVLRAAEVPLAPSEEVCDQIADAAVRLVDNGFFGSATTSVCFLWFASGCDELGVFLRSLHPVDDEAWDSGSMALMLRED